MIRTQDELDEFVTAIEDRRSPPPTTSSPP